MTEPIKTPDFLNSTITNTLIGSIINSSNNFKKCITDIFKYIRTNFKNIIQTINPINILKLFIKLFEKIYEKMFKNSVKKICVNQEVIILKLLQNI